MAKLVPSLAGSRFAQRASIGFGLITLITAVTAIGTALFARDEAANREKILEVYADDLAEAFQAQLAAEKMVAIGRGYLLVAEPEFLDRLNDAEEQLDRALQALERRGLSAREIELLAGVRRSAEGYRAIFDQILIAGSADARAQRVSTLREELMPRRRDLGARLEELVEHKRRIQLDARLGAHQMAARTFALALALSAIAVAFSVLLAWRFIQHLASIYHRVEGAAEEARRASSAREELLGIVAHDLRNPLNAISMKAASIARHSPDPRTEERAGSNSSSHGPDGCLDRHVAGSGAPRSGPSFAFVQSLRGVGPVCGGARDLRRDSGCPGGRHGVGSFASRARLLGRSRTDRAGVVEPDRERTEVHAARRNDPNQRRGIRHPHPLRSA